MLPEKCKQSGNTSARYPHYPHLVARCPRSPEICLLCASHPCGPHYGTLKFRAVFSHPCEQKSANSPTTYSSRERYDSRDRGTGALPLSRKSTASLHCYHCVRACSRKLLLLSWPANSFCCAGRCPTDFLPQAYSSVYALYLG